MLLSYANEISRYFKDLEKIPQVSSFLYDFTYWKEHNLLTETRYDELISSLNVDLRNINLLTAAYSQIYTKMKYELDKMIDQEEEYFALMAAEDEYKAYYDDTLDSTSLEAIYASNSKTVKNGLVRTRYLPIGCTDQTNKRLAYYGYGYNNSILSYQLPEMSAVEQLDSSLYYFDGNTPTSAGKPTYNYSNYSLAFSDNLPINTLLYVKYYSSGNSNADDNINLFENLANTSDTNSSNVMDIDVLCDNTIEKYQASVSLL
jgi:hypothetical protein